MNNDLKSSEALKAYARKVICGQNPTNSLLIRMFDEIIDNAPTVEAFTEEDMKRTIKENFDIGYEMAKNKYGRPQGEWIEMTDNHGHSSYFCSRCGTQEGKPYDVCQNCNADMQKGGSKPGVQANLKEVLVPYCNVTFDNEKLKELTDDIVERIRNGEIILQTESATEWIPVSERLPEEKINPITNDYYDYICTFHLDDVDDVRVYKFGNGHWWFYGQMMDKYVTAWMPRPEPWKGK